MQERRVTYGLNLRGMAGSLRKSVGFYVFLGFFSVFALLFVVLPLAVIFLSTEAEDLLKVAVDRNVISAIFMSVYTASLTTIISLIFGVPLAFLIARYRFPGRDVIDAIIDIPTLLPHTAAGIMVVSILGNRQPLGRILSSYGISFLDTFLGIVAAQLFLSFPYLVKSARDAFLKVDPNLEKAARTLGGGMFTIFFKIYLPLSMHAIFTGAVLTWARAISEFGAVAVIAYTPYTAPVLVYETFVTKGLEATRPIVLLLVIITLAIFIFLRKLSKIEYE